MVVVNGKQVCEGSKMVMHMSKEDIILIPYVGVLLGAVLYLVGVINEKIHAWTIAFEIEKIGLIIMGVSLTLALLVVVLISIFPPSNSNNTLQKLSELVDKVKEEQRLRKQGIGSGNAVDELITFIEKEILKR